MANMQELIARLEAADVGGQELNGLIFRMLADDPSGKDHWFMSCGELMTEDNADSVTTSLDAALALLGRVLPAWDWQITKGADEMALACISHSRKVSGPEVCAHTPALALCIAILKAKAQGWGG